MYPSKLQCLPMLVTTTRHPSLIIKGKIKAWLQVTPQRKVPTMPANIRQNQKLVTVTNTQGQAWSRLKNLLKLKSKFIESKFSELKSKSVFIESVFYVFVFDFGITLIISKNYDSIYFDTKFNRCYFDKYQIVSVL